MKFNEKRTWRFSVFYWMEDSDPGWYVVAIDVGKFKVVNAWTASSIRGIRFKLYRTIRSGICPSWISENSHQVTLPFYSSEWPSPSRRFIKIPTHLKRGTCAEMISVLHQKFQWIPYYLKDEPLCPHCFASTIPELSGSTVLAFKVSHLGVTSLSLDTSVSRPNYFDCNPMRLRLNL